MIDDRSHLAVSDKRAHGPVAAHLFSDEVVTAEEHFPGESVDGDSPIAGGQGAAQDEQCPEDRAVSMHHDQSPYSTRRRSRAQPRPA